MEETSNEEVVASGNEEVVTLASLPDEILHLVIAACDDYEDGVPLFEAVKGLGCVSKGMRQQLHRLRPLVGVKSLTVVKRPAHGPWRVTLLYEGMLTTAVVEQARLGRVRSINTQGRMQVPVVSRRVVPELLGAEGSLLELELSFLLLDGTWASIFGEAAACSAVLRTLRLCGCGLQGLLPELRLPALQALYLENNQLSGGLEPLKSRGCTMLRVLDLQSNQLTGGLELLRGCKALQQLNLQHNLLTGGLEPLRSCTALQVLCLSDNQHTGGLEPLRGCTALRVLEIQFNKLTGGLEPLRRCTALRELWLDGNNPAWEKDLPSNQLTGGLEPLRGCTALQQLALPGNLLTGGLEPLRGCTELMVLNLENNQLVPSDEDKAHFEEQCGGEFLY